MTVEVSQESLDHHAGRAPRDLMQAQYSIPFCVALACVRDIRDPRSMREDALSDPAVTSMLAKVDVEPRRLFREENLPRRCRVRQWRTASESFLRESASEWRPASDSEVFAKYDMLMGDVAPERAGALLERLQTLESQRNLDFFALLRT